jgi:hypothetical protein
MRPEYTSIAIVRHGDLIFFRSRPETDEESLSDVVHQTAMYYQDRLAGEGFARVLLGGSGRAPDGAARLREDLEARLGAAVEPIDPTRRASLSDGVGATAEVADVLSPLAGILLRTRAEAVSA